MDSKKHSRFTSVEAKISRRVGGRFMAYDGSLDGINLDVVPDKKIVQSWLSRDWPEGYYSRVIVVLKEVDGDTRLIFWRTKKG